MRARRARLELGVELAADEPWMLRELDDLDEGAVGRQPAQLHPTGDEAIAEAVRHFVAMAMTLADLGDAVHLGGLRSAGKTAGVGSGADSGKEMKLSKPGNIICGDGADVAALDATSGQWRMSTVRKLLSATQAKPAGV